MGNEPHRFDAVTHAPETTTQYVFIGIPALPLLRRNTNDLRNGKVPGQRRRWYADQGMKEVEEYCLRTLQFSSAHFCGTNLISKILGHSLPVTNRRSLAAS